MKKSNKITVFFIMICVLSFFIKIWLNTKLQNDVKNLKENNLKYLEDKTNRNFIRFGIENVGSSLRDELLKMDVDNTNVKLEKGFPFYFFQESNVYISNQKKTIVIYFKFDWEQNVFKIRGFQKVN